MPIKLIGRTTHFKGKPLWEILGNLKNHGIGRIVIRNRFQRYPESSYLKVLKVAALPLPDKPYEDRKVIVLAENTFRGQTNPNPLQINSASYKADYILVPKNQEHLFVHSNVPLLKERILPRTTDFPPLFSQIIMQQMEAKSIKNPKKPKLTLVYNLTNMEHKRYRIAEENEISTIELNFGVSKSSGFYPETEEDISL